LNGLRHPVNRAFLLVSVFILLFAVALRIYRIGQRSLWYDEAVAANISRGTLVETLTLTRARHSAPITHPLLLYVVEKVDTGPLAVRGPSLVASVLAVFMMLSLVTIPSIDQKTRRALGSDVERVGRADSLWPGST
jgi:predicted membrane-bound mannosyltransferase